MRRQQRELQREMGLVKGMKQVRKLLWTGRKEGDLREVTPASQGGY